MLSRPMHGWFYSWLHCRRQRVVHGGKCRQGPKPRASVAIVISGRLGRAPLTASKCGRRGVRFRTRLFVFGFTRRASVRRLLSCPPSRTLQDGQQVSYTKSTQTACICLSLVTQKPGPPTFCLAPLVGNRSCSRISNPSNTSVN